MYAFELFEQQKPRIVVTYPGRFQPFHQGHAGVFKQLQKQFGMENVYIATSNDQSSAKSPFGFNDKYQLMTAAGVPGDKIIETTSMYSVPDFVDPANTIFITAVGAPDAQRLNPDSVLKKDKKDKEGNIIKPAGSPGYYRTWDNGEDAVTADQHGYVIVIPEIRKSITLGGKEYDVSHGTECRNLWNEVRNDDELKKEFLKQLYGKYSSHLEQIFNKIPKPLNEAGGYIPTEAEKNDPRFMMALTNDIRPGATGKEANKLGLKTDAQGKPQLLMKTVNLKESIGDTDMAEVFAKFLPVAMAVLKIKQLPPIKLHKHVDAGNGQPTFGAYNPNNGEINLALADRHPTDILRTLAHELVHFAQDQHNELHDNSGDTGSDHENEANAIAGIIMRIFSKRNPDLIKSKPLQLKEAVTVNYGIAKNPGALAKVGPDGRVPHAKMHVNVDKATAKRLGIPVTETIRKIGDNKWRLYSKDGKKNLGTFDSLAAAKKHEREVQFFKHMSEEEANQTMKINEITEAVCPPATQDITLNLENRQKAIDEYGYGPMNPAMPNRKFWMKKAEEWNLDDPAEAKQSLCGNCAAFDIRQDTLDCIAKGIDAGDPESAEGVIDAGDLGYCKFLKFKCASRRTCDAWVGGGPLSDKEPAEKLTDKSLDKIEESCPHCGGPLFAESMLAEKQDACYYKVKSRYKVWPSAYASGALVQCRKKGAKNWGKKK